MERNLLLASFISFLMILLYYLYIINNYNFNDARFKNSENIVSENLLSEKPKESLLKPWNSHFKYNKDFFEQHKNFNVIPTEKYQINAENLNQRYHHFDLESENFLIKLSSQDASILSWKLKNYKDTQNNYIDVLFKQPEIVKENTPLYQYLPLGTYFQSKVNNIKDVSENYYGNLYDYQILSWEKGKVKVKTAGTFGDKISKDAKLYLKNGIESLKTQYAKDFDENKKIYVVLFYAEFYVQNFQQKFKLYKYIFLRENKNLIDFYIVFQNMSNQGIYIEANDQQSKKASFYTYWGNSLGPYYDEDEQSIYEKINVSYLQNLNLSGYGEQISIENNRKNIENFKWLAIESRYLSFFFIPHWKLNYQGDKIWNDQFYFGNVYLGNLENKSLFFGLWNYYNRLDKNQEYLELGFPNFYLKKNEVKNIAYTTFLGPKTRFFLNQDSYTDFNFSVIKDQSWIPLIKPLEWFIEFLIFLSYNIVHNYGVSIVLLAIILKVIFYPLTRKTTVSIQKMQNLSPKIKEIDRTFKNNPQKKQEALFRLYRKEKINPFSGCLPIIIQIPVFYALWSVLPSLLELKNVNFLWIHDLSSPDTVMKINVLFFGLIDINILPLLMTATSVIQIRLTPRSANLNFTNDDSSMNMMSYMQYGMPVVFLFLFWSMPSGLVLYWTVQNILQIVNQIYVNIRG